MDDVTTIKDIADRLAEIGAAMVEKGIRMPNPDIQFHSTGRVTAWLHAGSLIGGQTCVDFAGYDATVVMKEMIDHVKSLPSPEEKAAHDFATKLASVIEFGRDNGIDDEHIAPLVATRKAMTENLLTVAS